MTTDRPEAAVLESLDLTELEGPRVVAVGGGHGLARALEAIAGYAASVTAIVSVADDGGSSGRLTPHLGVPPPGDVRRAVLALSEDETLWRSLAAYRFTGGDIADHSLGNLMLAALADILGDFASATAALGHVLGARGEVLPVALEPLTLVATVDGAEVRGQVAVAHSRGEVSELRIEPEGTTALSAAVNAIAAADQIVIGPGSLYTSVLAALVVDGISEAVNAAPARLVHVSNLTTQDGETLGMTGEGHIDALAAIAGVRPVDAVVAHEGPLDIPKGLQPVTYAPGTSVVHADVAETVDGWPRHNSARLAAVLRRLV